MTNNMTKGNPFSLIFKFAIPLLLGNLFQQLYNMVDSAIVGQTLGPDALGSVGASTSVIFLIIGFCMGMTGGFAIPVAQAFGGGNESILRKYVYHAYVLTGVAAVFFTVLTALLCPQILHILHVSDSLYDDAYAYLIVIFLGIPFTLLYNLSSGMLRSVGDSRTPFLFLACSAILNIGLDFLFIMGFHWGTGGAAFATILSQGVSGILCVFVIYKKFEILHPHREDRRWRGQIAGNLIKMGVPMGLQYSITAIGSMTLQSANNALGPMYTSALAAALKIKQLTMCPFDALATATATFASQNYGAGKLDRIRKGVLIGVGMGVTYGIASGLLMIFFGRPMSMLFVSASHVDILDASEKSLFYAGIFFWTLGILNVVRLCVQGIGFSGRAVFSGVTEMVTRVGMATLLVPRFGFTAICITDPLAWITGTIYSVTMMVICMKQVQKAKEQGLRPNVLE
ncbi:MAG: MATE family efflux transporter [Lachnospiraceae bacterium]|nr:MATE family efflux transporter [Lachnospiraceae bacterium]